MFRWCTSFFRDRGVGDSCHAGEIIYHCQAFNKSHFTHNILMEMPLLNTFWIPSNQWRKMVLVLVVRSSSSYSKMFWWKSGQSNNKYSTNAPTHREIAHLFTCWLLHISQLFWRWKETLGKGPETVDNDGAAQVVEGKNSLQCQFWRTAIIYGEFLMGNRVRDV